MITDQKQLIIQLIGYIVDTALYLEGYGRRPLLLQECLHSAPYRQQTGSPYTQPKTRAQSIGFKLLMEIILGISSSKKCGTLLKVHI
jgi:hypothetical protein